GNASVEKRPERRVEVRSDAGRKGEPSRRRDFVLKEDTGNGVGVVESLKIPDSIRVPFDRRSDEPRIAAVGSAQACFEKTELHLVTLPTRPDLQIVPRIRERTAYDDETIRPNQEPPHESEVRPASVETLRKGFSFRRHSAVESPSVPIFAGVSG